jgi:hypothetical protein
METASDADVAQIFADSSRCPPPPRTRDPKKAHAAIRESVEGVVRASGNNPGDATVLIDRMTAAIEKEFASGKSLEDVQQPWRPVSSEVTGVRAACRDDAAAIARLWRDLIGCTRRSIRCTVCGRAETRRSPPKSTRARRRRRCGSARRAASSLGSLPRTPPSRRPPLAYERSPRSSPS